MIIKELPSINTRIAFRDLKEGDTFLDCCDEVTMKTKLPSLSQYIRVADSAPKNTQHIGINLKTGQLIYNFDPDRLMVPIECKLSYTKP